MTRRPTVHAALLTALACVGVSALVGRARPTAAGVSRERPPYASRAPITTPRRFGDGVISTRDYERDGSFTPDGRTFYFTKRTMWSYYSAICVSHFRNGVWTTPEVAPFSGEFADAMPFVSPNGDQLYFASKRPVGGTPKRDWDLWMMDRSGPGWSAPRHLPAPINTAASELEPVMVRSGALYFASIGDHARIVRSERLGDGWSPPVAIGDTSDSSGAALGAYVSPDERYMIVAVIGSHDALRTAEGIYDRADLYVRERRNGQWGTLRHLDAPINSAADELAPFVSPDGQYLFFTSERGAFTEHPGARALGYDALERGLRGSGNGLGDIYQVDLTAAGLSP